MATQQQIISAARFYFQVDQLKCPIAELKNISSQVEPVEYIYNDEKGAAVHTRQFGKTKPPNVVFVTGVDQDSMLQLFAWHEEARAGLPSARKDTWIFLEDAGGTAVKLKYELTNAWLSKLEIGGAKAGATEAITITVTLECDNVVCTKG